MQNDLKNWGFQEYLSAGYFFLLILGVITESVFYRIIGINILQYAGLSDILISPISLITANPFLIIILLLIIGFAYLFMKQILPRMAKRKAADSAVPFSDMKLLLLMAQFVLFLFIGIEIGRGYKLKQIIHEGKTKPDFSITFSEGGEKAVKVIGQNAGYLFYVPDSGKQVIICPIGGNIVQMQKIIRP
jgi:hypothetical protein